VDASHLISKANLWKERDEAKKKKYDKLQHRKNTPRFGVKPQYPLKNQSIPYLQTPQTQKSTKSPTFNGP